MKNNISQLTSIVLLFLIIVGSVLFVLPMRDKISELQASKDTLTAELQTLDAEYESLAALSEAVAASETTRNALKAAVPTGYDQEDLLLELSQMATDLDFTLNAVNFSSTVDTDLGTTLTITANFDGTYDDLVGLLQKIETADRLMQVTSMSVQRTSTSDIAFNLSIEAYYQ